VRRRAFAVEAATGRAYSLAGGQIPPCRREQRPRTDSPPDHLRPHSPSMGPTRIPQRRSPLLPRRGWLRPISSALFAGSTPPIPQAFTIVGKPTTTAASLVVDMRHYEWASQTRSASGTLDLLILRTIETRQEVFRTLMAAPAGNSYEGNVAPCLIAIDIYPVSILYSSQVVLIDRLEENEVLTAVGLLWSAENGGNPPWRATSSYGQRFRFS